MRAKVKVKLSKVSNRQRPILFDTGKPDTPRIREDTEEVYTIIFSFKFKGSLLNEVDRLDTKKLQI